MIRLLIIAIFAAGVAVASSNAGMQWRMSHQPGAASEGAEGERLYEYRKTRVINVPVIADGALLGYVIAQFLYGVDIKLAEKLNVNVEAFVLDDAFRSLYGDLKLDFRHLDKYDISGLTLKIRDRMNERFGAGMIKEILVQDFAYMPKDQAPK